MQTRHKRVFSFRLRLKRFPKAHFVLYVALGAIFLLGFLGVRTTKDGNMLLAGIGGTSPLTPSPGRTWQISSRDMLVPETPELVFLQETALRASTPPVTLTPKVLGAIVGQVDTDIKPEVLRYEAEEGDTLSSVAKKFGISQDTIVWANDLSPTTSLKPGRELIILPVSGTLHLVRAHDTLSEIASWYKGDAEEIVAFNHLSSPEEIFAGDLLIIPNGVQPKVLPQARLTPLPNSYFIWPIPAPHRVTQGLHPFNAVDLSNGECGESVHAAAGGTVQRTGTTRIGGKYVRILHPNDVVTYYGHLSAILVNPGQKALQGQIIGYTGRTGLATGCHVHFEVRGAENPFIR